MMNPTTTSFSFQSSRTPSNEIPLISYSGWMTKKGQNWKSWKKRYFVLQEGILLYFKDAQDLYHPQGIIYLQSDTFVDENPALTKASTKVRKKYKHLFMIRAQGKRFLVSCSNEEEQKAWIAHVQHAISRFAGRSNFGLGNGGGISEIDIDVMRGNANGETNGRNSSSNNNNNVEKGDTENRINPQLALQQLQKEQQKVLRLTMLIDSMSQPFAVLSSKIDDLRNTVDGIDTRMDKLRKRTLKQSNGGTADEADNGDQQDDDNDIDSDTSEEFSAVRRVDGDGDTPSSRTFTLSAIKKATNETDPTKRVEAMMIAMDELSEEYDICKDSLQLQLDQMLLLASAGLSLSPLATQIAEIRQQQQSLRDNVQRQLKKTMFNELVTCRNQISDKLKFVELVKSSGTNDSDGRDLRNALQEQLSLNRHLQEEYNAKEKEMKDQIAELSQHKKILVREVKNLRSQKQK